MNHPVTIRAQARSGRSHLRIGRLASLSILLPVAGLNSTPELISMVMFVIYSLVAHVSYTRSSHRRDKKGQVSGMKSVKSKISGRKWAAPSLRCSLPQRRSPGSGGVGLSAATGVRLALSA